MIASHESSSDLSAKVVCISHLKDVDGCVCAALVRCATKSSFLLTDYGHIEECLRKIQKNYDLVYLCDLGISETLFEEFVRIRQFAELIYIDHHHLDEIVLERLREIGVEVVHNPRECASILTFNFLNKFLPRESGLLASFAAVSDRLETGPIAKELIEKYDREFILFETMLLSYALERADVDLKRRIVCHLSELEYPHQIEGVTELALEQANRIVVLRRELPSRASKLDNVAYVEARENSPGTIANLLLDVCEANIGIGYNTNQQKQTSDLSIRGRSNLKINLGKVTSQLAEQLGGFGGGHPRASGARIPTSTLPKFIQALVHQTK